MQIMIERASLLKALDRVRSVVEAKNKIPILGNVRLEVKDGNLTLTTTDLDMEAVATAPAAEFATVDGATTVPSSTFYELVRKLPEGCVVSLAPEPEGHRLMVKAGRSKFMLPILPAADFPIMTADHLGPEVLVTSESLLKLIDNVGFCMSSEPTRYYLNGLLLQATKGQLRAVATDGHRLALSDIPDPGGAATAFPSGGVIVPRKTVREMKRMLEGSETLLLRVSSQKIHIATPKGDQLTSKVIDGAFPDYERVIPKGNERVVLIDPGALHMAVDRVATISSEKSRSVKLAFDGDQLRLTVRNMEAGQAVEELEVEHDGGPYDIGFNARYVLDVMGKIKVGKARFEFSDPGSPVGVLDTENPAVHFVLMPLRV